MAFTQDIVDWKSLIKLTPNGLSVPDYATLRRAVETGYKLIFGNDIDTSTGTADGMYLDYKCLILNNIIQNFKNMYSNLDVDMAQGKYLEMLCTLSNVFRKQATRSSATVKCTLDENEALDYEPEAGTGEFSVLDSNGRVWTHKKNANARLVFKPGVERDVIVECEELGPVQALRGSIDRLVDNSVTMTIEQDEDAYLGDYAETDSKLRARRNQSLGASGITVTESLVGALLSRSIVRDVKIYNNITLTNITAKDGTTVVPHDVYICVRYANNVPLSGDGLAQYDAEVGSLIYEKMTPGIQTAESDISADNRQFDYPVISKIGVPIDVHQYVNWKHCSPVHPSISIELERLSNYSSNTENIIKSKLAEYLNNVEIGTDLDINDLIYRIRYYDPQFRGKDTYKVTDVRINGGTTNYSNADTYYNYTDADITIVYGE